VIQPGDRSLLIVENDLAFAKLLVDVAHDAGFKTLVTAFGAAALSLARQYLPSAITLDISLPDIDGWRVLERLKSDFGTRHIPVKVITTGEDLARCRALGALSVLAKPIRTRDVLVDAIEVLRRYLDRARKDLILVHPDESAREELRSLLVSDGVNVVAVPGLSGAADWLRAEQVDCLVVGAPPEEGELEALSDGRDGFRREVPLIVYGSRELTAEIEATVRSSGSDVTVIPVASPERLVDQCTLRLHQPVGTLSERQRHILDGIHHSSQVLAGRKVLIVDDDIRNIFALTSILERQNMTIVSAETGRDAVDLLGKHQDVEVVLMDVMMPEMDGFETTQAIRRKAQFKSLPIIAVTAKAMKGDREKCIEAGASDYLSKPVDPEVLVAKLRDWVVR
jgi:CheY-like chemotaxis protein